MHSMYLRVRINLKAVGRNSEFKRVTFYLRVRVLLGWLCDLRRHASEKDLSDLSGSSSIVWTSSDINQ